MSSNLGFLLTLIAAFQMIFLSVDFISLQSIRSTMDACSITLAKQIAIQGRITEEMRSYAYRVSGATLNPLSDRAPGVGETYEFELVRDYLPVIMKDSSITVRIVRCTVIGYLD